MNVTIPIENSVPSSKIKHKFLQWAMKWCYANADQTTQKPDVASIVCLMQAIGFHLREFEKNNNHDEKIKDNSLKIILECGSSNMRAVLELEDVQCQCARYEDAKDASFWSVSGTTGSIDCMNKFEETGSNMLPTVSKDNRAMIHDVLHCLLNTINSREDVNQNRESTLNLSVIQNEEQLQSPTEMSESFARTRCLTQPEIHRVRDNKSLIKTSPQIASIDRRMSISAQNITKLPLMMKTAPTPEKPRKSLLQRQKTWDLNAKNDGEPRPSPPKISSSPVVFNDLCSSLGQISLQSDEDSLSLTECLRRIQFYSDKAMNAYKNLSITSKNESLPDKPKFGNLKTSPRSPNSRPNSVCSTRSSPASVPANPTIQKPLARRSAGASMILKQATTPKVTPSKLLPRRKSIGSASQSLKLSLASAQRNTALKRAANKPLVSSTSSLSSNESKVLLGKKKNSPDPKSQSPLMTKPRAQQLKPLASRTTQNKSSAGSSAGHPKE